MKKILILICFTVLILAQHACFSEPLKGQTITECKDSELYVEAKADGEFAPDIANIVISVKTRGKTAQIASDKNKEQMNNVIKAIKQNLGTKDKINTSSYNIYPITEYDSTIKKHKEVGFEAVNQIIVKTYQLDKVGFIIDKAVESGATNVNKIGFEIDNTELYYNQLLEKSIKIAKKRAEITANALGVKITGIKEIRPYNSFVEKTTLMRAYAASDNAMTPIEPKEINLEAGVNITFYITP